VDAEQARTKWIIVLGRGDRKGAPISGIKHRTQAAAIKEAAAGGVNWSVARLDEDGSRRP